jgi:eukaryotic-like serine/threonine-protein kinase
MNPNLDSARVKEIFEHAIDFASNEDRQGYVEGVCDGDAELQARVQTLLRVHFAGDDGFLPDKPRQPLINSTPTGEMEGKAGTVIGRYKLLQEIGEGGCGVVWMAEQAEPVRRRVALKVIKLGMDTKSVIARFEAERQALAMMDHPNIAKVLDAGSTDSGRPYFVMELVRGIRLTKYCDQHKLPVPERLDLFIKVCQAIQHAHQKGVIHRDIKPSNILVTLHDGVPVPKVIDFGIAKATDQRLTDKTLFTRFDSFIGTPAYMSPEQAEMSGLDIDTRTDIYSLGVLLYELLTGVTPFDAQTLAKLGLDELRRIIREDEPKRPSTRLTGMDLTVATALLKHRQERLPALAALVQGDLDWIVMKCLEKDRTRRYETANGLVADLKRHLNNEAIVARPASAGYRLQKAVRRHKLVFAAAAAVMVTLVAGLVIASWQAVRATNAEHVARRLELMQRAQSEQARQDRDRALRAENAARSAETATRSELENARAALAFIRDDLLGQASPDRQPDPNLTVRALLDRASASIAANPTMPPKVEAAIRQTIGSVNFALHDYKVAIGHLESALALQRKHVGKAHEDTLTTFHFLSETQWWNGDDLKATELAAEGWALSRQALGETHFMTLHLLADLALARMYGEREPAEEIDRGIIEALRVVSETSGETDPLAFRLKIGVAMRHLGRGESVESERVLTRAIERQRAVLRESDPLMLEALATLAKSYAVQGKYERAEPLYRRVLELRRSIFGVDHALTVTIETNLAWIYLQRGDASELDKIHNRLLELLAQGALVESRFTVRGMLQLLRRYRAKEEWGKIDELGEAMIEAGQRKFKTESLQVVVAHDELARSRMTQNRYAEAEPHFRTGIAVWEKFKSTHGRRYAAISRLGECLFRQNKDLELAEEYLKVGYAEQAAGWRNRPEHVRLEILGGSMKRLADFYEGTGRPELAAEWNQKLAELERAEGRKMLPDVPPTF